MVWATETPSAEPPAPAEAANPWGATPGETDAKAAGPTDLSLEGLSDEDFARKLQEMESMGYELD